LQGCCTSQKTDRGNKSLYLIIEYLLLNIDYLNQCNQRRRVAATEGGWLSVAECFLTLLRVLRDLRSDILFLSAKIRVNLRQRIFFPAFSACTLNPTPCTLFLHIERGVHGVLNKNKKFAKNFYSRPTSNLPQKNSCGRGTIFAWIVHIRAKGREAECFAS
jgi:hypothetical protein